MVDTPHIRATQAGVLVTGTQLSSGTRVPYTGVLVAYGHPTKQTMVTNINTVVALTSISQGIRLSELNTRVVAVRAVDMRVTHLGVLAAVRGRTFNPKLRAWTYTLDGHDFYVLKLSDDKTLVLDLLTEQWSWFSSPGVPYWRLSTGHNWVNAGNLPYRLGSNVVCGDDTLGILWVLDADQGYDDDPRFVSETAGAVPVPYPFERRATGQVVAKGRTPIPCFQVYLTASQGQPALVGQSVRLEYSDTLGKTYVNAGEIVVNMADFGQEFAWRSLGLIKAPGRLLAIEDDGAVARIDSLEVFDGQ